MAKKVTIRDIACEAGVSVCCVSWVLGNHPRSKVVSEKTRQRILDAAARLGYVQNQLAAATRTGQVSTIAVIMNFNPNRKQKDAFSNQVMQGIMEETSVKKCSIKVFSADDLEKTFRLIVENRISKVISTCVESAIREQTAALAEKFSINLVFCFEHGHGHFPAVNTDNAEMTARAVHYFAERGHSKIGMLCVPHWAHYVEDRHAGYLRGMTECGLKTDPRWISCSDDTEDELEKMLSLPEEQRPTAFVALADNIAVTAQRYAWKRGLSIPQDFSVIGAGDTEAATLALVPVTTFREVLPETGKLLVRLLLGEKPDFQPDEFNVYRTHAEMIERESVCNLANRKIQVSRRKSQDNRKQKKGNRK